MAILYIVNAVIISILFLMYRVVFTYTNTELNDDEKKHQLKTHFKESFILFGISSSVHFIVYEHLYENFLKKIINPSSATALPPQIFTDKPGF
jgi:hypothetical protein